MVKNPRMKILFRIIYVYDLLMCKLGIGHSWDDIPNRTFRKCVWCGRVKPRIAPKSEAQKVKEFENESLK